MFTHQTATQLIRKRNSCRSYTGDPIEHHLQGRIQQFLQENTTGPFGSATRFSFVAATPTDSSSLKGLGTYGFIKGATGFIIGAVDNSDYNLEDFGYLMEKNILFATGHDLGTCWLGGSFNKSMFSEKISAKEEELVPAVVATGLRVSRRRLFDSAIRLSMGSANRKPWETLFYNQNFNTPLTREASAGYDTALDMVRLAPSASNKQPWRIVMDINGDTPQVHLFLQRSKNYYERNKSMFGLADLQRVDMGIAMCHFELACREVGIDGEWVAMAESPFTGLVPESAEYVATWTTN